MAMPETIRNNDCTYRFAGNVTHGFKRLQKTLAFVVHMAISPCVNGQPACFSTAEGDCQVTLLVFDPFFPGMFPRAALDGSRTERVWSKRDNAEHPQRFAKVGYCALTGLAFLRALWTQGVALG
jgi:hypothetical protein